MKVFSDQTLRACLALGSISLLTTVATLAQSQATPTSRAQDPATLAQPAASPKPKPRIRRAAAQPKTTATPQPAVEATPAVEKTPAASPSPVPAPQEATPVPSVEEAGEEAAEETPPTPKVDTSLKPEARLREQLQVVEQKVAQGLKQEALAELHALAAENRFDPQGFYNIGNAFARLDATDAAVSAYRKAIDQRKGNYSRASNNLGVVLLRQGFWDQAYEAFLSALRAESFRYAEASYNLGRLYAARGEMDRALREWRRALAVDPNHPAATQALKSAGSARSVSRATAAGSNAMEADRAVGRNGNPASAANAAGKAFTLDADTHELLQRARAAHENGRYEEAIDSFRRVMARQGGYFSPANLELSYSLMELRRNDEAIAVLLLVAEKDAARYPITYYHLGRLYELRGDLQLAEENYLRATQSQAENAQFLLNLSGVREKRGDFAGALVAMENYIKRKEQQGQKPEWSDARLATLREKAAAQTPKQPQ
jgi:tetratricopeptide (TPR) repeat protein